MLLVPTCVSLSEYGTSSFCYVTFAVSLVPWLARCLIFGKLIKPGGCSVCCLAGSHVPVLTADTDIGYQATESVTGLND